MKSDKLYQSKEITKKCYNDKFRISAPTQNDIFEVQDGSYSVSDI